jgi:hypothetical protein
MLLPLVILTLAACASMDASDDGPAMVEDAYEVIVLEGAHGPVALLDPKSDAQRLEPPGGATWVSRYDASSAPEALGIARRELADRTGIPRVKLHSITSPSGDVAGYQAVPWAEYEQGDVLPNLLMIRFGTTSEGETDVDYRIFPLNPRK